MSSLTNCANIVKCIGTIFEINIEFIERNNNILLRGSMVLKSNEDYIKFNFFTNKKMTNDYYDFIELFGIPYKYISSIDKDPYTLKEELIQCNTHGKIKVISENGSKKEYVINNNNPSKLFVIATINEYGNNITYAKHSYKQDGLGVGLQGVLYKMNTSSQSVLLINPSKEINFIKLKYEKSIEDNIKNIPIGCVCDFDIEFDNGFIIEDSVVRDTNTKGYKIIGFEQTDKTVDKKDVKRMIHEYQIEQEMKSKSHK